MAHIFEKKNFPATNMTKRIIISLVFFLLSPIMLGSVKAITYDLIAPQGQLRRGDQVQFTIYINTEGVTLTTAEIGFTYEIQYLEYLGITPGVAMTSVVTTPQGSGSYLITGTNISGFNGNDVYAYLNFKLIADAPGETQLCALWAPPTSPTPIPTIGGRTPTPNPTLTTKTPTPTVSTSKPTSPTPLTTLKPTNSTGPNPTAKAKNPAPTSLPKTGSTGPKDYISSVGGFFLLITTLSFFILKRILP